MALMILDEDDLRKDGHKGFGQHVRKIDMVRAVVRVSEDDDGSITVYVHRRSDDGSEQLPLGYMLGHTCLEWKP